MVHPLQQNNPLYSVARPTKQQTNQEAPINKDQQQRKQPQAHSAKATRNNQPEHEPTPPTKQPTQQRVDMVRAPQSLSFLSIEHLVYMDPPPPPTPPAPRYLHSISNTCACHGITFEGEPPVAQLPTILPPSPPRATKSALHLPHPRLPRNHILR